jgi:hypothetical protein
MPNHCENDLYIDGPKERVAELLAFIGADKEKPEFDFNAVIPYPAEYAQRDEDARTMGRDAFEAKYGSRHDGFNSGGYEWRINNWGTKWGAYQVQRRDRHGVCITFRTAWSPGLPVIAELHKRFPECGLSLEYFERGAAFCGGVTYAEAEWAEDYSDWTPGVPIGEWRHDDYRGNRGG